MKIADLANRTDLTLVDIDYEVDHIHETIGSSKGDKLRIGGFFVKVGEGEYIEVYGYTGRVPSLDKEVIKLV